MQELSETAVSDSCYAKKTRNWSQWNRPAGSPARICPYVRDRLAIAVSPFTRTHHASSTRKHPRSTPRGMRTTRENRTPQLKRKERMKTYEL